LVQAAVWPVTVVVVDVAGKDVLELPLVNDQIRSSSSRRRVAIHRSAIAFAVGARTGVRTVVIASAVKTASKCSDPAGTEPLPRPELSCA
jgi:hypothetical protein